MENEENFQESQLNVLHYVAYSLLIIALGVVAYLYAQASDEVEQSKNRVEKTLTFRALPQDVQAGYKSIEEYRSLEMSLKVAQEQNERLLAMKEKTAPLTFNQTKSEVSAQMQSEVKSEVKAQVQSEVSRESLDEAPKDAKLIKEFASCYDMGVGSYNISWKCKKSIISFIDRHKNAKYFEVIPLVDDAEFILYKNLQNNDFIYDKLKVTQKSINLMKKFSQSGLAKHRAIEASWVIKAHTNRKAKVYGANYHLMSHDEKRGILVRAYE